MFRLVLLCMLIGCQFIVNAQYMAALTVEINGSEGLTRYQDSRVLCELMPDGTFSFQSELIHLKKTGVAVVSAPALKDIVAGYRVKVMGKLDSLPKNDTTYNTQARVKVEFGAIHIIADLPLVIKCKKEGYPRFSIAYFQPVFNNSSQLAPKERAYFDGILRWEIR
jgi:hypothetical protein